MKSIKRIALGFLLCSLLSALPGLADTVVHTVNTVEALQDALTEAQDNGKDDFIVVEPGVYDLAASPLTYSSTEDYSLRISGLSGTPPVLKGSTTGDNRALTIFTIGDTDASVVVMHLIISGSRFIVDGGGLYIQATGDVTISNCRFEHNVSAGQIGKGGGAFVRTTNFLSKTIVADTTFEDNSAAYGGGIYVYSSSVGMEGNRFIDNELTKDVLSTGIPEGGGGHIFTPLPCNRLRFGATFFQATARSIPEEAEGFTSGAFWRRSKSSPTCLTEICCRRTEKGPGFLC